MNGPIYTFNVLETDHPSRQIIHPDRSYIKTDHPSSINTV